VNGRTDGVGAVIANDIFLNDRRFSKDGNSSSANPTRILMAGLRVVLYQVANDERDGAWIGGGEKDGVFDVDRHTTSDGAETTIQRVIDFVVLDQRCAVGFDAVTVVMRDDDVADRRGCSSYVDSADGGDASAVILDATILNREPVQNGSPRLAIREVGCGCASFAAVKDGVGGAAGRAGCAGYQNGLAVEVDVLVIGAWIDEDGVACVCGVDGFLDLLYGWPGPTSIVVCAKAARGSKGSCRRVGSAASKA
jgi:hypothetical protein